MSHLQTSSVLITDLELFEKVVASFPKLQWNHDKKEFNWYASNVGNCDHCITYDKGNDSRARGHQVGVVRAPESQSEVPAWKLQFDPYDQALAGIIGESAQKLLNEYSEAYARKFAEANGFTVEKSFDGNGDIILELIDSQQ